VLDGIDLRLAFLEGRAAIQSHDMVDVSRDFGPAGEVGAHKADAGTWERGFESDGRLAAGVQADSRPTCRLRYRLLFFDHREFLSSRRN
jgi:hypothetical protein